MLLNKIRKYFLWKKIRRFANKRKRIIYLTHKEIEILRNDDRYVYGIFYAKNKYKYMSKIYGMEIREK